MSNDGNKSARRVPFTMFSSSAEGGYLTDLHANFTSSVELNNMHTDTYGDFRHAPMQGPFTEQHVGGMPHRHTKIVLAGDLEAVITPGDFPAGWWDENSLEVIPLNTEVSPTDTAWELTADGLAPIDVGATSTTIWEVVGSELMPGEPDPDVPAWRIYKTDCKPEGFYIVPLAGELNIHGSDYRSDTPRSWLYRDEYAKRPLNIRNIKNGEPCNGAGNFDREYEVVQIAGRTLNPRHYAEFPEEYTTDYPLHMGTEGRVFNNLTGSPPVAATGTLPDYELPNSSSLNKFIFVNRFSAPGDRYTMSRGFLNPIGEEMSVYNVCPFRNLSVRKELSEDLATHTPKATDIPPDSPTKYHTTNRNTRLYKTLSGSSSDVVIDKLVYDDGYATHAIPQSTLQYSWITASAETTRSEFPGFATGSDIQFYSNSVGFSSPMNNVYIDPDTAVQSFDFTGSVYTYGTWKEIRGGQLALSRHYREHNILPVTNVDDQTTQYIEPPIVAKHMPMEHVLSIDTKGTPYLISSVYGNKLVRYSNEAINLLYDFNVSDKDTMYSKFLKLYLNEDPSDIGNPIKGFYSVTYGQTLWPKDENAFMGKVRLRGKYTEVPGTGPRGYDRLYGTQNTMYSTTLMRDATALNSMGMINDSLAFDPMKTDGVRSFPDSGSFSHNVGEMNFDTDMPTGSATTASLDYFESNYVRLSGTQVVSTDYTERLVEEMTGKTRWYDSYDLYAANIKGLHQETSIVPEFRISEFMNYYINDKGGSFRAPNKNFLSILGADYSSSAQSAASAEFDVNFENTYLTSEKFNNLKKIKDDHIGFAKPKQITLKATGIKKLLPYNGFYPDTRTVQLGNILSSSLLGFSAPTNATQSIASLSKPLVSPGILYNSLKAGIAVDYPCFMRTGSEAPPQGVFEWEDGVPNNYVAEDYYPNLRLPFETLVNLNEHLPTKAIHNVFRSTGLDVHADDGGTYEYDEEAKWTGTKKPQFEMACHNFLASSVGFFLKDSKINSFISAPETSFKSAKKGTRYQMDIVLRDEVEMNKFAEYGSQIEAFPTFQSMINSAGSTRYTTAVRDSFPVLDIGTAREPRGSAQPETQAPSSATQLMSIETPRKGVAIPSDMFGHSVAICDGGDLERYILVGDPGYQESQTATQENPTRIGAAYLYREYNGVLDTAYITRITGSRTDDGYGSHLGWDVAMTSGSDGLYMNIGEPRYQRTASAYGPDFMKILPGAPAQTFGYKPEEGLFATSRKPPFKYGWFPDPSTLADPYVGPNDQHETTTSTTEHEVPLPGGYTNIDGVTTTTTSIVGDIPSDLKYDRGVQFVDRSGRSKHISMLFRTGTIGEHLKAFSDRCFSLERYKATQVSTPFYDANGDFQANQNVWSYNNLDGTPVAGTAYTFQAKNETPSTNTEFSVGENSRQFATNLASAINAHPDASQVYTASVDYVTTDGDKLACGETTATNPSWTIDFQYANPTRSNGYLEVLLNSPAIATDGTQVLKISSSAAVETYTATGSITTGSKEWDASGTRDSVIYNLAACINTESQMVWATTSSQGVIVEPYAAGELDILYTLSSSLNNTTPTTESYFIGGTGPISDGEQGVSITSNTLKDIFRFATEPSASAVSPSLSASFQLPDTFSSALTFSSLAMKISSSQSSATPEKLYWVDRFTNNVMSSSLDGSASGSVITSLTDPYAVAVDSYNDKIIVNDNNGAGAIYIADLDGGSVQTIDAAAGTIYGLCHDDTCRQLTVAKYDTGEIVGYDLNGAFPVAGTTLIDNLDADVGHPIYLTVSPTVHMGGTTNGTIYWTQATGNLESYPTLKIRKADQFLGTSSVPAETVAEIPALTSTQTIAGLDFYDSNVYANLIGYADTFNKGAVFRVQPTGENFEYYLNEETANSLTDKTGRTLKFSADPALTGQSAKLYIPYSNKNTNVWDISSYDYATSAHSFNAAGPSYETAANLATVINNDPVASSYITATPLGDSVTISIDEEGVTYDEWTLTNTLSTTTLNGSSVSVAPPAAPCGTPRLWILEHNAAADQENNYAERTTTQLHVSMLGSPTGTSNSPGQTYAGNYSDYLLYKAPEQNLYKGNVTDQEWSVALLGNIWPNPVVPERFQGPAFRLESPPMMEVANKKEHNYFVNNTLPVPCDNTQGDKTYWKSFTFHRLTLPMRMFKEGHEVYGTVTEQAYCPSFWDNQIEQLYPDTPYDTNPTTATREIWETTASYTLAAANLEGSRQFGACRLFKYTSGSSDVAAVLGTEGYFPPKDLPLVVIACTSSGDRVLESSDYGFEFGSAVSIASASLSDHVENSGLAFTGMSTSGYILNYGKAEESPNGANLATYMFSPTPHTASGGFSQAKRDSVLFEPASKKIETSLSYYSGSTSTNTSLKTAYDALDHFIADSNSESGRTRSGAQGPDFKSAVRHFNHRLSSSLTAETALKLIKAYGRVSYGIDYSSDYKTFAKDLFMVKTDIDDTSNSLKYPYFNFGAIDCPREGLTSDDFPNGTPEDLYRSRIFRYDTYRLPEGNAFQTGDAFSYISGEQNGYMSSVDAFKIAGRDSYYLVAGSANTAKLGPKEYKAFQQDGQVTIWQVPSYRQTDGTVLDLYATASLFWDGGSVDDDPLDGVTDAGFGNAVAIYVKPDPGSSTDAAYCVSSHSKFKGVLSPDNQTRPWPNRTSPVYVGKGKVDLLLKATGSHDYKMHGSLFGVAIDGNGFDPHFAPYTPPGFYGDSVATLTFTPSFSDRYDLASIFEGITMEENIAPDLTRMRQLSGSADYNKLVNGRLGENKMAVNASVNLLGQTSIPGITFGLKDDGTVSSPREANSSTSDGKAWAIHTKFEAPVIDVSSSLYAQNYTSHYAGIETVVTGADSIPGTAYFTYPRSPWTSAGTLPPPDKGYKFELRETPGAEASLIDLCGFTPGSRKVGSIADNRKITEALMIIPYVDRAISSKSRRLAAKATTTRNYYKTTEVESGMHFIRLNMEELKRQKQSFEDTGFAVSEEIPVTSYSQMIEGMSKYVIPPQYNFLKYKDIKPFAAYFLEFEHTLTQEDLINIWQGVTPSISLNPEIGEVELSHDFDKHNFFHNIPFPDDIKFMVFKVKQKANWNYYDITTDSTDDNRFRFDLAGDGKSEAVPDYSYNWPYDFCTLVERAKVDVSVALKKEDEE